MLADSVDSLIDFHDKVRVPTRREDVKEVYIGKTLKRIESVIDIIPDHEKTHVTINRKQCRNPYHEKFREVFFDMLPSQAMALAVNVDRNAGFGEVFSSVRIEA